MIEFPISGVETYWWLPIVVAFIISSLTSVGGISGAFLIMPFQISFLGFAGPAASSTNLLFNILAIPGGVYRQWREKRMVWSLAWAILLGSIPGMFIGAIIRVKFLPDAGTFKIFVGLVLLYLGGRLCYDMIKNNKTVKKTVSSFVVKPKIFNLKTIEYEFNNEPINIPTKPIFFLGFVVGIIGGAYGIGGGSMIVPFLVAIYAVPVHTLAGTILFSTFATSIAGVGCYYIASLIFGDGRININPDWLLGLMFGIGGFAGIYFGARIQRYLPAKVIKIILAVCMLIIAIKYLIYR